MSDQEAILLHDVMRLSAQLMDNYTHAHHAWVLGRRELVTTGLAERLAVYISLRAMLRAFDVAELVTPADLAVLNQASDAIEISTGPVSDVPQDTAKARA